MLKKLIIGLIFFLVVGATSFVVVNKKPTVNIELSSTPTTVSYELKFSGTTVDRNYLIKLSNDNESYQQINSIKETTSGEFIELTPGTEYTVTVFLGETIVSKDLKAAIASKSISTTLYTFDGISFNNASFEYDGTSKSIYVTGAPNDATITYTGNEVSSVGTHTVTAIISKTGYQSLELTANLTIAKGKYNFTLEDQSKTYDGTPLVVELDTNLDIEYKYYKGEELLDSAPVEAGEYTVKAIYAGTDSYEGFELTANLTINKATPTLTVEEENIVVVYGETYDVVATLSNAKAPTIKYYKDGIEISKPTEAGRYTAIVSYDGDNNYNGVESLTINIAIALIDVEITLIDKTVEYNGEAQEILADTLLPVTYEYYLGETKLDSKPVNVGVYTVKVIYAGDDNHAGAEATATLTINKATYNMTNAKWNYTEAFTYDETQKEVLVTGLPEGVTVESYTNNKNINAGTYTASVVLAYDTVNYNTVSIADLEWKIEKGEAVITVDETPIEITYGEVLTLPTALTNLGTVTCDKTLDDLVNAGTYTVTYTVEATDNYNGDVKTITVKINKATYDMRNAKWDYASSFIYNGTERKVEVIGLPTGVTVSSYSNNKYINVGEYTASVVLAYDTVNYNTVSIANLEWKIEKATPTLTVTPTSVNVKYGEAYSITATLSNSDEPTIKYYKEGTEVNKPINVGAYTAVVSYSGNSNYNGVENVTINITISKAVVELSIENKEVTYNGEVQEIVADASVSVVYEYYLGETKLESKPVNVGEYTVKVIYAGDDNHAGAVATATLTINKATYNMTNAKWDYTSAFTYDGTQKEVLVTGLPTGVTVASYTDNKNTNAGTYTASVVLAYDTVNYNTISIADLEWKINKGKAIITVDETPIEITYGEVLTLPTATTNLGTVQCDKTLEDLENAGTYTVTYVVLGTENYVGDSKTISVKINKASYDMTNAKWNYTEAFTYDGSQKEVLVTGLPTGVTVASYANNKNTNAGTYTASVVLSYDIVNYNTISISNLEWKINKAQAIITVDLTKIEVEFGEEFTLPVATTNFGTVVCDKTVADFTAAGTYTVTYKVEETDNYKGDVKQLSVVITNPALKNVQILIDEIIVTYKEEFTVNYIAKDELSNDITESVKELITITYNTLDGNKPVNAGTYTVTISFAGNDEYNGNSATQAITINKASYDMSNAKWNYTTPLTYTGNELEVLVTGLPEGVTVESYTNNKYTNVGIYKASVVLTSDTNNYEAVSLADLEWKINKGQAVITVDETPIVVTFGEEFSLPEATTNFGTVVCDKTIDDILNIGKYTITYVVLGTENYSGDSKTISVTVKAKVFDMSNAKWTYTEAFTYDGTLKEVLVTGLPEGVTVLSYKNNQFTDAGSYRASVTLSYDTTAYEAISMPSLDWEIVKATPVLTVETTEINVAYGTSYMVLASLSNKETPTIKYYKEAVEVNKPINVGSYTAVVSYSGNSNYNGVESVTVNITITKAVTELTINNKEVTYNGQPQEILADTSLLVTYEYYLGETKLDSKPVNVGIYTVKVIYAGDDNHASSVATATLTIKKATYDMSNVEWNYTSAFTYNGELREVLVTGLPTGVTVLSYTNNKYTNAGQYTASVALSYDTVNYNTITVSDLDWEIKKATPVLTVSQNAITVVEGTSYTVVASLSNDEIPTIKYYQGEVEISKPTEVGAYTAVVSYSGNSNYNSVESITVNITIEELVLLDVSIIITEVNIVYGTEYSLEYVIKDEKNNDVTELLNDYVEVTYNTLDGNKPVNAGSYRVTVSFEGYENYVSNTATQNIVISKATFDMSNARWNYENPYKYNGNEREVKVTGLPKGVSVESYSNNKFSDVGVYTASVVLAYDADNYNTVSIDDLVWEIEKATPKITIESKNVVVDYLDDYEISATLSIEEELTYKYYSGETEISKPSAVGKYSLVISFEGNDNYNSVEVTVYITINRKLISWEAVQVGTQLKGRSFDLGVVEVVLNYNDDTTEIITTGFSYDESVEYDSTDDFDMTILYNEESKDLTIEVSDKPNLMIYAAYGAGGNSGAKYNQDFIILYNNSNQTIDLSGYTIQYGSSTAKSIANKDIYELTGSVKAYSYYVIAASTKGANGANLPFETIDVEFNIGLGAEKFVVVLSATKTNIVLATDEDASYYINSSYIDLLGVNSDVFETEKLVGIGVSSYAVRKAPVDTDNNKEDFEVVTLEGTNDFTYLVNGYYVGEQAKSSITTYNTTNNINFNGIKAGFTLLTSFTYNSNNYTITWSLSDNSSLAIGENGVVTFTEGTDETVILTGVVEVADGVVITLQYQLLVSNKTRLDKTIVTVNHFDVTWTEVEKASSYDVYVNGIKVKTVTSEEELTYTLEEYNGNTTIYVVANPTDAENYASSTSDEVSILSGNVDELVVGNKYMFEVLLTYKTSSKVSSSNQRSGFAYDQETDKYYALETPSTAIYTLLGEIGYTYYIYGEYVVNSNVPTINIESVTIVPGEQEQVTTEYEDLTGEDYDNATYAKLYQMDNLVVTVGSKSNIIKATIDDKEIQLYHAAAYNNSISTIPVGYIINVKGIMFSNSSRRLIVTDYTISDVTKVETELNALENPFDESYTLDSEKRIDLVVQGNEFTNVVFEYEIKGVLPELVDIDAENNQLVIYGSALTGNIDDVEVLVTATIDGSGVYRTTTFTFDVIKLVGTTYTVTFKDGDNVISTATVLEGNKVTKPEDPTKTGYTFKHWSTVENGTTEFDFNTEINEDTILYAVFEVAQVEVLAASMSFADTTGRTVVEAGEKHVWSQNGINLEHLRGTVSNTTKLSEEYINPVRVYKNHIFTISFTNYMTKIVFNCSSTSYATVLGNSITGSEVNGKVVTIIFETPVTSFEIVMTGATRINSFDVYSMQ